MPPAPDRKAAPLQRLLKFLRGPEIERLVKGHDLIMKEIPVEFYLWTYVNLSNTEGPSFEKAQGTLIQQFFLGLEGDMMKKVDHEDGIGVAGEGGVD